MKWLLLFLFCLSGALLRAQVFEFSEPIEASRDIAHHIIGKYENQVLLFCQQRNKHQVHFINDSLRVSKTVEIDPNLKHSHQPLMIVADKTQWSLLFSHYEKGKTVLECARFDAQCKLIAQYKIAAFDGRQTLVAKQIAVSANKKQIAIYQPDGESEVSVAVACMDSVGARWQKNYQWDEIRFFEHFKEIQIDNEGQPYLIFEHYNSPRRAAKHYISVYTMDSVGSASNLRLPVPNINLQSFKTAIDEKNKQLLFAGFTSDDLAATGFFYARMPRDSSAFFTVRAMDEGFLRSFTGLSKKKLKRIYNLEIKNIIPRQDGGLIFITEETVIKNYEMILNAVPASQVQAISAQADFFYGSVLFYAFHPSGAEHWKQILYKHQDSENDNGRYSSFLLLKTQATLTLLYNSEIILNPPVYKYEITGLGEAQKNLLNTKFDKDCQIEFADGLQTAHNQAFAYTTKNSKVRLVRITF